MAVHRNPKAPGQAGLLRVEEVAELTNTSTRTVQRLARRGLMPTPIRMGSLIRWQRAVLEDWIAGGCHPIQAETKEAVRG